MAGRPTVLLFDLDGTLVLTGGAGRRAMERAFDERVGRHDVLGSDFGGMTDRSIVRAGLRAAEARDDDAAVTELLDRYVVLLREEVPRATRYRVMPGVRPLLQALGGRAGTAIGLGTGNVREGAMIKLRPASLDGAFAFGGFGCDHDERAPILELGARRGAESLGAPRDECRVVVIGDTPRDVAAAQAIGAECLAVATGGKPVAELAGCGATWAVADLTDPTALAALRTD